MARGKTQRRRLTKRRRNARKTRVSGGGEPNGNILNLIQQELNAQNAKRAQNERNAAQGLLAFSRGFYVRKPTTITTYTKLEYLRAHEKDLALLLEPYTLKAKAEGKPRNVMINEYKQFMAEKQTEFLREFGLARVTRLEDILPAVERIYPIVFNILNNSNPKELRTRFDPVYLAKIVIYTQELIKYSEQYV